MRRRLLTAFVLTACGPADLGEAPPPPSPAQSERAAQPGVEAAAEPEPEAEAAPEPEPEAEAAPEPELEVGIEADADVDPEPARSPVPTLSSCEPTAICVDCIRDPDGGECEAFSCDGLSDEDCEERAACGRFIRRATCAAAEFECEVYGEGFGSEFTCEELCAASGGVCVGGWDDDKDSDDCSKDLDDVTGCDSRRRDQICRCALR